MESETKSVNEKLLILLLEEYIFFSFQIKMENKPIFLVRQFFASYKKIYVFEPFLYMSNNSKTKKKQ